MMTCCKCKRATVALYPDKNDVPGKVCKQCFVPPVIKTKDMTDKTKVKFKNLKRITCFHKPCRNRFKQQHPADGFCCPECKRLDGNRRSKEQREEMKND